LLIVLICDAGHNQAGKFHSLSEVTLVTVQKAWDEIISRISTEPSFISFSHCMNRPKSYKKHMKHATDLFWASSTDSARVIHWRFDGGYAVVKREELPQCDLDCMVQKAFSPAAPGGFPIPTFEPDGTLDSGCFNGRPESNAPSRSFLPFPDGLWSQLHSTESAVLLTGSVGFF
jgi:hypothetical protein